MKNILLIVCASIIFQFSTFNSLMAQVFVGLNGSGNIEATSDDGGGITIGMGADCGFLHTSIGTWGLSANRSLTLGTASHTGTTLSVLHVSNDWRDRTAFILGAGVDIRSAVDAIHSRTIEDDGTLRQEIGYRDRQGYGLLLRAGVSFKWHLYLTGNVTFGSFTADKDVYSMHHTPAGIHYDGYSTTSEDHYYFTLGINLGYRF